MIEDKDNSESKIVTLDFTESEENFFEEEERVEEIHFNEQPYNFTSKYLWWVRIACFFVVSFQILFLILRLVFCPVFLMLNIITFFSVKEFIVKLTYYKNKFYRSLKTIFYVLKFMIKPNTFALGSVEGLFSKNGQRWTMSDFDRR